MPQDSSFIIFNIKGVCEYLKIDRRVFNLYYRENIPFFFINKTKRPYYLKQEVGKFKNWLDKLEEKKKKKYLRGKRIAELKKLFPLSGVSLHRKKTMSEAEKEFVCYLESQNKTWEFEPCGLDTGIPCKKAARNVVYIPDFWCPKDGCYYEVSATRQAREISLRKIKKIRLLNPKIKIVVVRPDGTVFGSKEYDKSRLITANELSKNFKIATTSIYKILLKARCPFQYLRHSKQTRLYNRKDSEKAIKRELKRKRKLTKTNIDGNIIHSLRMKYKIPRTSLAKFIGIHWAMLGHIERKGKARTESKKLLVFFKDIKKAEKSIKENLDKLKFVPTRSFPTFEQYYPVARKQ